MNNQYYKHKMDDLLRWFGQAYVPIGTILVELYWLLLLVRGSVNLCLLILTMDKGSQDGEHASKEFTIVISRYVFSFCFTSKISL